MPRKQLSTMTPAEIIEHQATLNRDRQKRYYDKNKDKMSEKSKLRWSIMKQAMENMKTEKKEEVELPPAPAPVVEEKQEEPETKKIEINTTKKKKGKKLSMKEISLDIILGQIGAKPETSKPSLKVYEGNAKQMMKVLNVTLTENLVPVFKDYKKVFKEIDESDYALNVKKGIYQFIIICIDRSLLNTALSEKIQEHYRVKFDVLKEESVEENKQKIEDEPQYKYSDYMKLVEDKYGKDSKMYIISRLYRQFSARDDFQLVIVSSIEEATDFNTNYFITNGKTFPKDHQYTILLRNFKTNNLYKPIEFTINSDLSRVINEYMIAHQLREGNYLFGDKKLTKYISEMNKKIGVIGGINTYRHMAVSEFLEDEDITTEERVKKARLMAHSPLVQLRYLRKKTH